MFLYFCSDIQGSIPRQGIYADYPHLENNIGAKNEVNVGPDGKPGIVFTQKGDYHGFIGFDPSVQTWIKAGSLYLCMPEKFNPEYLEKPDRPFDYYEIELHDKNLWKVVIARPIYKGEPFPKVLKLDDSGQLVAGECLEEFVEYSTFIGKQVDNIGVGINKVVIENNTEIEIYEGAALMLSCLYNISKMEIGAFGLLTTDMAKEIWCLAADGPVIRAMLEDPTKAEELKKKGILEEREMLI